MANRLVPYRSLGAEINRRIEPSGRGTTVLWRAEALGLFISTAELVTTSRAPGGLPLSTFTTSGCKVAARDSRAARHSAYLRATMGGGHDLPTTPATRTEMADANLAVAYRDACAHLLIPLNKCRRKTFYMPWECGHLRHEYERCQYVEWLKRSKDETVRASAADGGGGHH